MAYLNPFKRVANFFSKSDAETTDVKFPQPTGFHDEPDDAYLKPESVQVTHDRHQKLGEGTFAKVYEGKYRGQPCAVKVFRESNMLKKVQNIGDSDSDHDMVYLCALKAPNIVNIHGLWFDPHKDRNALSLVMELCDTSLYEHIKSHKAKGIPKSDKLKILHDVTNAMIYLHDEHIVHGDLRSPNILLVNTGSRVEFSADEQPQITAKVADFDLARHVDPKTLTRYTTTFADEDFLPPEAIDDSETTVTDKHRKHVRLALSVDVFCFGPLTIELACMEFPKPAAKVIRKKGQPVKVSDEIERREKYLKKIDFSERTYTDLIVKKCMADRPEKRGSFLDLQVIIEAFQKKVKERPDQQLLEEQQATIYDMRRKSLAERENLNGQLQEKNITIEKLKDKLQQTEKDLEKEQMTMAFQKQACQMSQEALNESSIKLAQKEGEMKRIKEEWKSVVTSKDNYHRETLELKIRLQELENQLFKQEKVIKELNRDRLNQKQELEKSEKLCNKLKKFEEESKELQKIKDSSNTLKTQLEGEMRKVAEAEDAKTKLSTKLAKTEKLLEDTKVQFESEMKQLKVDLQTSKDEETSLNLMLTNTQQLLEKSKQHLDCERSKWGREREQLEKKHAVAVVGKYLLYKVKNRRAAVHLQTKLSKDAAEELKEIRDKMERLKFEIERKRSQWDVERERLAKQAAVAVIGKCIVKKQMSTKIKDQRAKNEQSLNDRNSALEEKVKLKQSVEMLKESLESKQKEIGDLQAELQREKEEVHRLASKIRDSKEHTLKDQMKKERQKFEQECKENEKRRADAEKEFKKQLKTHSEEKKTLEKERDELKREKTTLNQKIKHLQDELTDVKKALSSKQKELSAVENEAKNLKADLKRMERTETSLKKSVEEEKHSKEAAVNQLKKERQKFEQECKELERRQTDAEKEFKKQSKTHSEEKKTLEKERDELKREKTILNQKMDSLKNELAELKPKLSSKQQELGTIEKEVMELMANLRKMEKTETSLRKDLEETECKLKDSQGREENLSQSLNGLQRAKTVVEDELHKLKAERDSALENVRELKNKLASKTVEYDNSVNQYEEKLQTSKRTHSKQNLGLMTKCSEMETQLKDLVQKKNQEVQNLEKQLKDQEQEKVQAVQRKDEMRLKVDDLEKEKKDIEKLALSLQSEVRQKEEEFKRYERTVKELKEKLEDSTQQHGELKQKWKELTRHSEDDRKSLQTKEEEYEAVKKTLQQKEKQLHEMKESNSQTDDEKSTRIQNLEEEMRHCSEELQEMKNRLKSQEDVLSKQKTKTESDKRDLQNEIKRLDQAKTKLKSDCDKQLQLVEHNGKEQIEKLKRKTIHLEDKLSKKENDLHQKQREVDVMSEKVKESQELLEKEKETKQQKVADCRRLEHELMLEKKHHKEMTEEYQTKVAHLEDEKENLLKEMANLEEAGNRLVREKAELEVHVAKLKEQLVNMEADIKALEANRDELVDEKEHLQGMVNNLKAERANLTSSTADLRREKGELLEERMRLEEKFTEASKKCDVLQETCSFLKGNCSKLEQQHRSSLQANEEEINLLREVVSETQLKLQESQTDRDSTLKQMQKLQAELNKSNECAEELKAMNDQLDAEVKQWKTTEHALSVTVTRKDRELEQLTLEVTDFKGKFEGVRVQHQDLIDKFETLAIEKEEYQKKYEELTHVDEKLELERNDLEKKVKDLEVRLSESVTKAKFLDGELAERTSEMENLRGERDSLEQALRGHEKKLSKCSVTLDETRVKLAYFEEEYERVQCEYTQVQNEKKKIKENSLRREKVLTQQLHHIEEVTAIKQLAIEKIWVESFVDKCFNDTVRQMSKDQLKRVSKNLEDTKSELNNTKDKLMAVTTTLAEEAQKFQHLQYRESCQSELLSSTEEDLRQEREKCARYRNEVADLENAQMDVVVQKDAIERDLAVVRGKNEQFQKELSRHQHRLLVVERDLRQAKDAGNQLRAQCGDLKVRNKTVEEENTILHKALEAQTLSSVQLQKENTQLRELKKQEKQIKSQKQSLRQGRKALQQDMVDLEKKKASLEGKEELLREERNLMTQQCLEDDKKLKVEQFRHLREEQLVAVEKTCSKIEKSFREQQKTQKLQFEGIVQEIDVRHTKQSEEQEFVIKSLEQSGASVIRGLQRELYSAKVKMELIDTAAQKVSKPLSADVQVNPDILDLLQKFEIVCKLLNCYEPRVLDVRNSGFCQPPEEMSSKCDLNSFKVFDVCEVQYLDYQFKLPFAVENFVQSFREHTSGPSIVCSLPFIVYTDVVCFCHLLVATSPFQIAADPKDVLRMEPTLVCILAKTALTGDLEQNLIRCQKGWKNISKGLIFHPTWCGREPNKPITLKHPPVNLPVKLEPVLEQLKLMTARKLHELKPELVRSLCPEQTDQ